MFQSDKFRLMILILFVFILFMPVVSGIRMLAEESQEDEYESDYEEDEEEEDLYVGLAQYGFILITIGILFYSITKRTSLMEIKKSPNFDFSWLDNSIKLKLPISSLGIHQIIVVIGSVLTVPHFFSCTEYEGLFGFSGLLLGVLILLENLSGFYGSYLHSRVEKLRIKIDKSGLEYLLKKFRLWRKIHILGTFLMYLTLAIHIILAE